MTNVFYTAKHAKELTKCHLSLAEVRCHRDGDPEHPCPDCGGEVKILVETAWAFKALREELGEPITVTSGHRCRLKQERLFREAVKKYGSEAEAKKHVAPPGGGPHERSAALDLKKPDSFDAPEDFGEFIWRQLNGDVRLGVYDWGCHIDRAHILEPNPDPKNYVKGVKWRG